MTALTGTWLTRVLVTCRDLAGRRSRVPWSIAHQPMPGGPTA